ncbi:ABC transporter ATP-binding protein [Dongia sedimenti]|uniref:ABC transporter ATP-binding protein n=1 Tax=Dongia sedimenti TaxID=3064282 RepID=A0ABU0YUU2_9PROT|nr:ABC transporter ATP-binding protein [Rhodospirillaceae bacterium R-7]
MTAPAPSTSTETAGGEPAPAVELIDIDKSFGAVHANRDVSIRIAKGTIHGIVGENGAGKSTLMSILYGFYEADRGAIRVNGRPVRIRSSKDAIAAGIGMVHQHFMLVDTFSVIENVMLGAESGMLIQGGIKKARAEMQRLERDYGLSVDPDAVIGDLPVGEQQRVEILKALYRNCEILILDEPTGVLTPQETDQLFQILKALKERGVTVILITHKLREIMAITDTVTVMRHGAVVAERKTAETDREELAVLMVGRKVRMAPDRARARPGEVALGVAHLGLTDAFGVKRLDDINFSIRAGEILGVAGVSGNGQSELLEVLSGIRPPTTGVMHMLGRDVTADKPCSPKRMRRLGVAHVPEDRHRLGLVTGFPAWESAILGYQRDRAYGFGPIINTAAAARDCGKMMEAFDVRPQEPNLGSAKFSGGNQQKLILAREMARMPKILLVGQPTRGVDIGAIEFIHRQIVAMRDEGTAVLLVSVELDEILALSDRIIVMFQGRIVGETTGDRADERQLGLWMANAHADGPEAPPPGLPPLLAPELSSRSGKPGGRPGALPPGMKIRPRK